MAEPQCIQASVSASTGGRVALVKYGNLTGDFHYSINRTYSIPEDWTEEQVEDFQATKLIELRERLEPIAQAEADELMDQSALFHKGEYIGD